MRLAYRRFAGPFLLLAVFVAGSCVASAQGVLDKLKNMGNQNKQQQSQSQSGSSSGNSVTNLNGLDNYNKCMARSSGYHEKLLAGMLQHHLDSAKNDDERRKIQEDVEYLTALSKGQKATAPDPRNSQRYLLVISDDEQTAVNTEFSRYSNQVHDYCEERFGGMSQFGDPQGRRPTAKLPEPQQQEPVVTASARPARPQNAFGNCMASRTGLQWKIMADKIETKMATQQGLSAADRKAWTEDIAMLRAYSENPGKGMPQSPDPRNPMRYFQRLNADEQMAVNQEYASQSQTMMAKCQGGGTGGGTSTASSGSNWTVENSRTRRGRDQGLSPDQQAAAQAEAQTWLDAHPMQAPKQQRVHGLGAGDADYLQQSGALACVDRAKGFRAKLMADRLAAKRDSAAPQDRRELDGWIAAWRSAAQSRGEAATPPSGSNPNRDLQFLTNADQQEINMANGIVHNTVRDQCNSSFGFTDGKAKK